MIPYTNIHTHRPPTLEPKECIGISSFRLGYDSVLPPAPFSAGIHPWDATEAYHRLPELLQQLKRCGAAAVGEIGLDHASGRRNESCQTTVLTAQLQSASALRLPVIIHCVKAFELLMELLAAYSLPAVIFHGYTGSPQQTERLFACRILPLGRTDIAAVAQNGSIAPGSASPSSFHRNRRQRRPDRADVHCRRRPPQYTRT